MPKHIVLVEDEHALRENYIAALSTQGYSVQAYDNVSEASAAFTQALPDLVMLDIGLHDEFDGGFKLCQQLRQRSATLPILFFTARDNDIDTISGLRMGADDYLTKDISLAHLLARIAALFRRSELQTQQATEQEVLKRGALTLDRNRMSVAWQNHVIDLTVTEFWMLNAIVQHDGHVKSREQLMESANMVVDDTTINSHIKRIRKKFVEVDPAFDGIETVYGMGYRWRN
ncbi:MAG: proteobacterial dedicated sortase system response regulator [Glaciecola sp.]|jgi:two-component system OmpR family response regulator